MTGRPVPPSLDFHLLQFPAFACAGFLRQRRTCPLLALESICPGFQVHRNTRSRKFPGTFRFVQKSLVCLLQRAIIASGVSVISAPLLISVIRLAESSDGKTPTETLLGASGRTILRLPTCAYDAARTARDEMQKVSWRAVSKIAISNKYLVS